ncbi:MAG TPA: hypothetical protein VFU48_02915 [Nitrospira sp.]|nr:hypothetical protein [Nitrospira sp.]
MMREPKLKDITVDEAGTARLRQEVHESVQRCAAADKKEHRELARDAVGRAKLLVRLDAFRQEVGLIGCSTRDLVRQDRRNGQ